MDSCMLEQRISKGSFKFFIQYIFFVMHVHLSLEIDAKSDALSLCFGVNNCILNQRKYSLTGVFTRVCSIPRSITVSSALGGMMG